MEDSKYIGNELSLFKEATNWKKYWLNSISKYLNGDVLEVGAGIGINTNLILQNETNIKSIVSIEPDKALAVQILNNITKKNSKVTVLNQYLEELPLEQKFDTIIYIDVIEHIKNTQKELNKAKLHLKDGGCLIILVPAYNFLFSPFDKAVGHFRRYNKKMLCETVSRNLELKKLFYLDSLGVCASLVNKYFLKQAYPNKKQILKWDQLIIPCSKIIDKLVFNTFGKSLIGIWRK